VAAAHDVLHFREETRGVGLELVRDELAGRLLVGTRLGLGPRFARRM
jgi:hypothetical protein